MAGVRACRLMLRGRGGRVARTLRELSEGLDMNRGRKDCFWALALLFASACTSEDPPAQGTCPPLCATPNPVLQGADSGSGLPDAGSGPGVGVPSGSNDAGSVALSDAGRSGDGGPVAVGDAGSVAPDAGVATDAGGAGDGSVGGDASLASGSMLPPVTDYAKPGPFKTTKQANVGPGNNYTIFRPEPLGENGFVHSPIIFGPGILTDAGFYSAFLTHLASHGFVTISVNSMGEGPGGAGNLAAMTMGLDWMIAQNAQAGVFKDKLAVERAAAMGYSIGATASVQLSSHKALATIVPIHGHGTKGDPHGPALLITGTSDVIDDVKMTMSTLEEAPAILVALPIGHLDVLDELAMLTTITPTARYIAPITAWLRYWLHGDQGAKRFFAGSGCEMCKSPWVAPETNAKWKALML
jgi:hypothetical protein